MSCFASTRLESASRLAAHAAVKRATVAMRRAPGRTDEERPMSSRTTTKPAERGGKAAGLQGRVRDTISEIKKVSWPDQETTRNLTLLVIGMAAILGAILGGIDAIFIRIWEWIPS